jgi:nucleotidyltransferase substrate binding protein (TIGR01987 family)
MHPKETRWRQRFIDFTKSLLQLEKGLADRRPDDVVRAGIIQFFEMSFELAWKTLKDYLEAQGYDIKTPRETLQQAFQLQVISDGHAWIEALEKRNLMAHTYNENTAREAEGLIRNQYFKLLKNLEAYLIGK